MSIHTIGSSVNNRISYSYNSSSGPKIFLNIGNKRQNIKPKPEKYTPDFSSCVYVFSYKGIINSSRKCRRRTIAQHGSQPNSNLFIPILNKKY